MAQTITARSLLLAMVTASSLMTPVAGFLHDCKEVDYAIMQAHVNTTGEPARIGTDGLYAPLSTVENDCLFVSLSPSSDFASAYPGLYSSIVEAATEPGLQGFKFPPGDPETSKAGSGSRLMKRQRGCGSICTNASCDSCTCKWDYNVCVPGPGPNNCFGVYRCK